MKDIPCDEFGPQRQDNEILLYAGAISAENVNTRIENAIAA